MCRARKELWGAEPPDLLALTADTEQSPPFPGQLRFWNPDDLNASPGASPSPEWIEEKLQEVCEHLGITRDGHLNRKKLVSICEQYGLHTAAGEVSEHIPPLPDPQNPSHMDPSHHCPPKSLLGFTTSTGGCLERSFQLQLLFLQRCFWSQTIRLL